MYLSPGDLEELRNRIANRMDTERQKIAVRSCQLVNFEGGVTWMIPGRYARIMATVAPYVFGYMEAELGRRCYLTQLATI